MREASRGKLSSRPETRGTIIGANQKSIEIMEENNMLEADR